MPRRPHRRNILGFCLLALALLLLVAAIRHNQTAAQEARLYNLGALVYLSRPWPQLTDRLARSPNDFIAHHGPHFIHRVFGEIVAVDFGKRHDVSTVPADRVVEQLVATKSLRVAMIDGLALDDAQLARLASMKNLRELGLRNTKVTADGTAQIKQMRPDLQVQLLGEGRTR
ncbi:MAG: hypothetical protein ACR2OZ_06885 [Verrucomicrobiales bacterium]